MTDGAVVADIYFLEHTGKDVYHGRPRVPKQSYHASGRRHKKMAGVTTILGEGVPLKAIKGIYWLETVNIGTRKEFLDAYKAEPVERIKKADTALWIDIRTLPTDRSVTVDIGLMEPMSNVSIGDVVSSTPPDLQYTPFQVIANPSVEPWVIARVGAWESKDS